MRRLLIILMLAACGPAGDEAARDTVGDTAAADTAATVGQAMTAPVDSTRLILHDRVGHARSGMTIGGLRAVLPAGASLGDARPFMVDVDGMPIVVGGDTLYHVLIVAGESAADDAAVDVVATRSALMRTPNGIGPGTTLADAAAVLGAPTLSYNTEDESREYAAFPGQPECLGYRVSPAGDASPYAGSYATRDAYNETSHYDAAARISMVIVRLGCSVPL